MRLHVLGNTTLITEQGPWRRGSMNIWKQTCTVCELQTKTVPSVDCRGVNVTSNQWPVVSGKPKKYQGGHSHSRPEIIFEQKGLIITNNSHYNPIIQSLVIMWTHLWTAEPAPCDLFNSQSCSLMFMRSNSKLQMIIVLAGSWYLRLLQLKVSYKMTIYDED